MTKRDNELTPPELVDRRARKLLDIWEMHRGQLPEDLIKALEGLRNAVHGAPPGAPPIVPVGPKPAPVTPPANWPTQPVPAASPKPSVGPDTLIVPPKPGL